jgi:DNA adenine methylase
VYYLSPLRYPGGKAELAPFLARVVEAQIPRVDQYAEPFAGGAGAAIRLLADEVVHEVLINDLNPGIAAMWRSVVNDTAEFAGRIETQAATLTEWSRAHEIYNEADEKTDFELGFATFLLNRWNRSGILDARPIGGMRQDGPWKIDARFNRTELADRVRFVGSYGTRIKVSQLDGRQFIKSLEAKAGDALVYVDPPYLNQGDDLYLDSLSPEDHEELADVLNTSPLRWLLTYDVHPRVIDELYGARRRATFRIAHTAHHQHVGKEYLVFGDTISVPDLQVTRVAEAAWV